MLCFEAWKVVMGPDRSQIDSIFAFLNILTERRLATAWPAEESTTKIWWNQPGSHIRGHGTSV